MKALITAISLGAMLALAACGGDDSSPAGSTETTGSAGIETSSDASDRTKPEVSVPGGAPPQRLVERELIEGTGASAEAGDEVTVQYVGVAYENGEEFDASWDRGEPFSFQLGAGQVIPGWDQGVEGMKVGGRRQLTIPPDLAYGEAGSPPAIGPNSTLVFVVDLLEVN